MATRSKMSLTKELRMDMARLEIPVSGWTCLRTVAGIVSLVFIWRPSRVSNRGAPQPVTRRGRSGIDKRGERRVAMLQLTLVDVGGVSLLAGLGALLLVAGSGSLLAGILLLRSLGGGSRGLGGGLLVSGLGRHFGDVVLCGK